MGGHAIAYRADIDGLRAVAVLGVVLYHLGGFGITGGFGGVDVFFVISGFLIAGILRRECETGAFSLAGFYERRARRIFPALFAVIAVTTAAAAVLLLPEDFEEFGKSLLGVATFTSNYYFMRQTGYFDPAAEEQLLLHTWSLAVEEQFYLAFPLLFWLLYRRGARFVPIAIVAISVASFADSLRLVQSEPTRAFFATPGRAWELLLGALLAFVPQAWGSRRAARELASAGGLALIAFGYVFYTDATPFPGLAALAFCLGAALIISAGGHGSTTIAGRVLAARPLAFIGLISYSIYLWHWPLIVLARYCYPHLFPPEAGATLQLRMALLGLTLALAYLSWRYVEAPFRRCTGGANTRTLALGASAGVTAAFVLVALAIIKTDGWPTRWNDEVLRIVMEREAKPQDFCAPLQPSDGWPAGVCRIGEPSRPADTIIWGDSHARMLTEAFAKGVQRLDRGAIVAAKPLCPPFAGVVVYGKAKLATCREFADAVLSAIRAGDIRRVVLVGRWAYYAEGKTLESTGGQPIRLSPDGIESNASVFADLAEATVSRLRELGVEVVLFGPIPEHKFSVAPIMARNLAWRHELPAELSRADFLKRQRFVIPVFQRLERIVGVKAIYPDRRLCDADVCRYARGGLPLYSDSNHLTPKGSAELAPTIDAALAP